jgi:hypothetical protein
MLGKRAGMEGLHEGYQRGFGARRVLGGGNRCGQFAYDPHGRVLAPFAVGKIGRNGADVFSTEEGRVDD